MKIAVITMQGVYNYGSALQTYASQKVLTRLGHEVEIIDYYPNRMRNYGSLKQIYTDAKPFHKSTWKCMMIAMCKYPSMIRLKKIFVPFSEKYFQKTMVYNSNSEICKNPPIADIYCTGSDQVWNDFLEGKFDETYFLNFVPSGAKKIAFSASFGRDNISDKELLPVKRLLEQYSAISVREESGLKILNHVDIALKRCVLDPTFLLKKEEWMLLATPIVEKDYILVYKLHEDSLVSEIAIEIAKKTGKKIIRISTDYLKRIKNGKTVVAPKVEEFVSYIANAAIVVTDSFHATAFSLNLNVPFVSVKWRMFNDRIETILSKVNLSDRSVSTIQDALEIYNKKINFEYVNQFLEKECADTVHFLEEVFVD